MWPGVWPELASPARRNAVWCWVASTPVLCANPGRPQRQHSLAYRGGHPCSEAGACALEDCAFRGLRVSEQGPLGPGWLCRCTWRPAPALGHGDARVSQGERAGCGANQPLLTPWLPAYCLGALQGASATRPVNGHCRHSYGHCNKSPQTQLLK